MPKHNWNFKCQLYFEKKNGIYFIPWGRFENKPSLVKVMAWHRASVKPLSALVSVSFTNAYMYHSASILFLRLNWQSTIYGSHSGLVPIRFPVIICTNDCIVSWCIRVSLGLTEIKYHIVSNMFYVIIAPLCILYVQMHLMLGHCHSTNYHGAARRNLNIKYAVIIQRLSAANKMSGQWDFKTCLSILMYVLCRINCLNRLL